MDIESASGSSSGSATDDSTSASGATQGDEASSTSDTEEACVAQVLDAAVEHVPIDIVLVVDTSASMADAIEAVEASINVDFANILSASELDYRVAVLGDYPPGSQLSICVGAPLSGADCTSPPPTPAVTPTYQHYDAATGSSELLGNLLSWFSTPDIHGLAPVGYQGFLREDSVKVFIAMTDGTSASDHLSEGELFDEQLLALSPALFGSADARRYIFHSVVTMDANSPASAPWLPDDPVQGAGGSIQQVAVVTGGWRFPLSQTEDFDVVFQEIAEGLVETAPIACSFSIPEAPFGDEIDPNSVEVDFFSEDAFSPVSFTQVATPQACTPTSFYISDENVVLCPDACDLAQSDLKGSLEVRYGCETGFDPAG